MTQDHALLLHLLLLMKPIHPLHGLVAATHTPFHTDGRINPAVIEQQAAHMIRHQVGTVFINGSTAESSSLTVEERLQLAQRWFDVTRGTALKVVVHVGSNCLADSCTLARQAQVASVRASWREK
jgi:N-acetylneuraminate lyase